ncbi:MAG: hypothetical protein ACODAD_11945, partial [Planctomycetota bacterium]
DEPSEETVSSSDTHLIVVSEESLSEGADTTVVESLDAALSHAATLDALAEIELRFDGLRVLRPLTIKTDRIPENRVTIRAGSGFSPVLAFHSRIPSSDSTNPTSMIHVMGGRITWQGVHFYMALPEAAGPRLNQSLLRLDSTDRVEFQECTFTIRNLDPEGAETGARIAFVDVVGPGEFGGLMFDNDPLTVEAPTVWLENCIARGQAPFIRADFAVPFSFSWKHGLFISTQQLIEVGGTIVKPRWEHGHVNVFLSRFLSVADRGICLVRSDQFAPYQLGVSVKCNYCLFATENTKPEVPLYLIRTGAGFSPTEIPLEIQGEGNYYKNTQTVLRVETENERNVIQQYVFDDLTGTDSPNWYNERSSGPGAIFSWTTPAESVDRQSLHDYIPSNSSDTWFSRALTLDPSQLPALPEIGDMPLRTPEAAAFTAASNADGFAQGSRNTESVKATATAVSPDRATVRER